MHRTRWAAGMLKQDILWCGASSNPALCDGPVLACRLGLGAPAEQVEKKRTWFAPLLPEGHLL